MTRIIEATVAAVAGVINIMAGLAFAGMLLHPATVHADPDIDCGVVDCGVWSNNYPPGWIYGGYYGPGWYAGHYWRGGPWLGSW